MAIDYAGNVTDTLYNLDLWVNHLNMANHRLITNDTLTFVLNNQGIPIAEIEGGNTAFLIENNLYHRKDASFTMIDLKEIIGL